MQALGTAHAAADGHTQARSSTRGAAARDTTTMAGRTSRPCSE
jgi:hypothetical protein